VQRLSRIPGRMRSVTFHVKGGAVEPAADPATAKRRQKRVTDRTKCEVKQQVGAPVLAGPSGFSDGGQAGLGSCP